MSGHRTYIKRPADKNQGDIVDALLQAGCSVFSLAGNSGGVPDAAGDSNTCWLINPEDEVEIANAMQEIIEHPEKAKKIASAARERAKNHFNWNRVATDVLSEVKKHVR